MDDFYYVNVYEVSLNYGGAEEGGWYFDSGIPVASYGPILDEDLAWDSAGAIRAFAEVENSSRPDFTSVLSDGSMRVCVEPHVAQDYPAERPYYC